MIFCWYYEPWFGKCVNLTGSGKLSMSWNEGQMNMHNLFMRFWARMTRCILCWFFSMDNLWNYLTTLSQQTSSAQYISRVQGSAHMMNTTPPIQLPVEHRCKQASAIYISWASPLNSLYDLQSFLPWCPLTLPWWFIWLHLNAFFFLADSSLHGWVASPAQNFPGSQTQHKISL